MRSPEQITGFSFLNKHLVMAIEIIIIISHIIIIIRHIQDDAFESIETWIEKPIQTL